jgi:CDGSH-type Zn-finger protein
MNDRSDVRITACTDGPLLVRGSVQVIGDDGQPIVNPRRTIALCRCGASAIKPWCDGTHKLVRSPPAPTPHSSTG